MGTRSEIGILHKDGTVETIYCHWDGYLDGNGKILYENYNSLAAVKKLLEKGNMSSLQNTPEETEYYVNKGEEYKDNKPRKTKNAGLYLKKLQKTFPIEYAYLFDEANNRWIYTSDEKKEFISLEEDLKKHKVIEHEADNFVILTVHNDFFEETELLIGRFHDVDNPHNLTDYSILRHDDYVSFLWEEGLSEQHKNIVSTLSVPSVNFSCIVHYDGHTKDIGNCLLPKETLDEILSENNIVCPSYLNEEPEELENFMYLKFSSSLDHHIATQVFRRYFNKNMFSSKENLCLFWKNLSSAEVGRYANVLNYYKKNHPEKDYSGILYFKNANVYSYIGQIPMQETCSSFENFVQTYNFNADKFIENYRSQEETQNRSVYMGM